MRLSEAPGYLFLLAIYPIIALLSENVDWGISGGVVLLMVFLSGLVAVLGWPIAQGALGHRFTRGTVSLVWVAFWLWYGAFIQLFALATGSSGSQAHILGFPFWVLGLGGLGLVLERTRFLSRSTRYLNVFAAIFLLFPVLTLLKRASEQPVSWDNHPLPSPTGTTEVFPDIYFVILDGYSSTELLEKVWGHDNRPFEDSLRQLGFSIPANSHSNYVHTHLSLASMLNWQHLVGLKDSIGDGRDRSYTYAMIENNRAARFLQSIGYEFVFFRTTFPGTTRNRLANRQVPASSIRENRWLAVWFAQTPIPAVVWGICKISQCQLDQFPFPVETAEEFKWKFRHLAGLAREPGPKFVLAHVLLPHVPYVLKKDCSARKPSWPRSGDDSQWVEVQSGYVDQISCLNQMLLELVVDLLERSDQPPLIILQADHGHGRIQLDPLTNLTIPLEDLPEIDIQDRTRVFAAYHLPGLQPPPVYDAMTPVNVFPIVFNSYFGTEIPLQENATYWSEYRQSYVFTRVNPSLRRKQKS